MRVTKDKKIESMHVVESDTAIFELYSEWRRLPEYKSTPILIRPQSWFVSCRQTRIRGLLPTGEVSLEGVGDKEYNPNKSKNPEMEKSSNKGKGSVTESNSWRCTWKSWEPNQVDLSPCRPSKHYIWKPVNVLIGKMTKFDCVALTSLHRDQDT